MDALLVVVMSRKTTEAEVQKGLQRFRHSAKRMEKAGLEEALQRLHDAGAAIAHITTDGDLQTPKIIETFLENHPDPRTKDAVHFFDKVRRSRSHARSWGNCKSHNCEFHARSWG